MGNAIDYIGSVEVPQNAFKDTREDTTRVLVVGSVNLDLIATCRRLPGPGETVTDGVLQRSPGGKGANQALAAKRHGAEVALVAAVGSDGMADEALSVMRDAGVDLSRVVTVDDAATGVALIAVDRSGQNQIAIAPGANRKLGPYDVGVDEFDAVLCQLEVRLDAVIEVAEATGGMFCLNAAPTQPLPQRLLDLCDVIIVNEPEHADLADQLVDFSGLLIVTLGSRGAVAYHDGEIVASMPSPPVEAVDTVGAGDAFCGTLVASLASGATIEKSLRVSCAAGSHATTYRGAQVPI